MKSLEIACLINDIYDAVERSKAGPIMNKGEDGKSQICHVGYNTYLTLLGSLTPHSFKIKE